MENKAIGKNSMRLRMMFMKPLPGLTSPIYIEIYTHENDDPKEVIEKLLETKTHISSMWLKIRKEKNQENEMKETIND